MKGGPQERVACQHRANIGIEVLAERLLAYLSPLLGKKKSQESPGSPVIYDLAQPLFQVYVRGDGSEGLLKKREHAGIQ